MTTVEQLPPMARLADLTYPHPRIRDYTLDDNLPASIRPANHARLGSAPTANLGDLGVLPLELLQALLAQLDLRSLSDFRLVNRRAAEVVGSIPQYKVVTTHAPNVLRGILSIRTGRWITCEMLYDSLCTANCQVCGDFAGYLYILTCERVCFLCLSEDVRYLPLQTDRAIRKFGLNHDIIDTIPHMKSVPGKYSPMERKSSKTLGLVDYESAHRAGIAFHGSRKAMVQHVSTLAAQEMRQCNNWQRAAPWGLMSTASIHWSQMGDDFDAQSGNPVRFMAVTRAPWFNKVSRVAEWGFHCLGCEIAYANRPMHFRRKFTPNQFKEHLRQCGDIRDGKHQRK